MFPIWFKSILVTLYVCNIVDASHFMERIFEGRIVGGESALITDYPYQVAIKLLRKGNFIRHCGGAIIGPNVIITAAHCAYGQNRDNLLVIAGTSYADEGGVKRNVSNIVIHEKYDASMDGSGWDVALLFLSKQLSYTKVIQPIQLASTDLDDGEYVVLTGWGRLKAGGESPRMLQRVMVPMINHKLCEELYTRIYLPITDSMICAGFVGIGGKDACQGDSGGPMAKDFVLYGLTSWGEGCASKFYPGVFTRITAVRAWVRDKMSEKRHPRDYDTYDEMLVPYSYNW